MIEDSNSLAIGREGVKESRYSQIEGERNIEEKMAKLMACLRFEKCCLWLEIEEKKKKGWVDTEEKKTGYIWHGGRREIRIFLNR